jgi:AcrR family transcriptional regulator
MTTVTDPAAPSQKPIRGPHAERTAAMRQRLIEAAIACLHELGYAATTFQAVTDRAKVSRGAIVHHFPSKVDLMVTVAEYAAEFQNRYIRQRLRDLPIGVPLYLAVTEATWEVSVQPPAMALLEIMMATRADAALAERLPAVVTTFESRQREDVWRIAQQVGITDRDAVEAMVRLHRAAMRGLAIELSLTGDRAAAEASIKLLGHYKRLITGELITAG